MKGRFGGVGGDPTDIKNVLQHFLVSPQLVQWFISSKTIIIILGSIEEGEGGCWVNYYRDGGLMANSYETYRICYFPVRGGGRCGPPVSFFIRT